ncbi:MAG: hypothetical protein H0X39_12620 [Actinobacteria bacterium]|nr:hypothetical protein [Actinomycetota bacterium]
MTLSKDQIARYEQEAADEANLLAPTRAQSEADLTLHVRRTAGQTKAPHELESERASAQRILDMPPVDQANEDVQAQAVVGVEADTAITETLAAREVDLNDGAKTTTPEGDVAQTDVAKDTAKAAAGK